MKGYKAFGHGMVCRGKQYAENTTFEEPKAKLCECGMHFCASPLDVLDYYPLIDDDCNLVEIAPVEALDEPKTINGLKYCTTKLSVGQKIPIGSLRHFAASYLRSSSRPCAIGGEFAQQIGGGGAQQLGGGGAQQIGGNSALQVGGCSSQQIGCYSARQVSGYTSQQLGGNFAQQISGDSSNQIGGKSAQQVTGSFSNQIGGDFARQYGGYSARQIGGTLARQKVGESSIIINGNGSVFSAGLHSIVVCYWHEYGHLARPVVGYVDGVQLKPDVRYRLVDGVFQEVGASE